MLAGVQITPLSLDLADVPLLGEHASREGIRFLQRLEAEWTAEVNRFDRPGEVLLGAHLEQRLVGIAGLNQEPYEPLDGRGRLRHLYVDPDYRRCGIASALVTRLLAHAVPSFTEVRLRTWTAEGAAFYKALGFRPLNSPTATHAIEVRAALPARRRQGWTAASPPGPAT